MNDPNGLAFHQGRFRLWAQHSDAAPDYRRIGWGRWSSDDLLAWTWDGVALAPDDSVSAYSGSLTQGPDEEPEIWLTLNDHAKGWQTQHRAVGVPLKTGIAIGPAGRDCRDPFVFFCAATSDWRMIVSEPCGWSTWRDDAASRLAVWRSDDRRTWTPAGTFGAWHPPGIMYEVPVLIDFGDVQALVLSLVDRRDDSARCSVRYWLGRFDGVDFAIDASFPGAGILVDEGPDFYAAIANLADGWPHSTRVVIGWASSWATARSMPWPGGVHGGPMTMPRIISCVEGRLRQVPMDGALALRPAIRRWQAGLQLCFQIDGDSVALFMTIEPDGQVSASRVATDAALLWQGTDLILSQDTDVVVFIDTGLVEIFFLTEGRTLTAFVPGAVEIG